MEIKQKILKTTNSTFTFNHLHIFSLVSSITDITHYYRTKTFHRGYSKRTLYTLGHKTNFNGVSETNMQFQ